MQFEAVFPRKNSYQKEYKKEASNGKKGQWNFHYRSAKRRYLGPFVVSGCASSSIEAEPHDVLATISNAPEAKHVS